MNIVQVKSEDFAVRIINLFKYLKFEQQEYDISRQLLRSGTSIGANIAEAMQAQSSADFISKLSIALKEASETNYWLKLLMRTNYINQYQFDSINTDCCELLKLLTSILKTSRNNLSTKS